MQIYIPFLLFQKVWSLSSDLIHQIYLCLNSLISTETEPRCEI